MLRAADWVMDSSATWRGEGCGSVSADMVCSIREASRPPPGLGYREIPLTETRLVVVTGRRTVLATHQPTYPPISPPIQPRAAVSGSVWLDAGDLGRHRSAAR